MACHVIISGGHRISHIGASTSWVGGGGGDLDSRGGSRFENFVCRNKRNWTRGGGGVRRARPSRSANDNYPPAALQLNVAFLIVVFPSVPRIALRGFGTGST